jgi:hypothetical protein
LLLSAAASAVFTRLKELDKLRASLNLPFEVILFEPRDNFVFTPLLHEVATAGLDLEPRDDLVQASLRQEAVAPPCEAESLEYQSHCEKDSCWW